MNAWQLGQQKLVEPIVLFIHLDVELLEVALKYLMAFQRY